MKTILPVLENIFSANDRLASENRAALDQAKVFSINLMASPGAGKTSLIERSVHGLASRLRLGVIDGDIATSLDAERARLQQELWQSRSILEESVI